MHESLRHVLVLPLLRSWLDSAAGSWRAQVRPTGKPSVTSAGPDPDRILLVGSGVAVGYGTPTHDLALAGYLARQVSRLTGRGAHVDVLVTEEMTGDDVRKALDRKWLGSVDTIVATPGGVETLLLHSARAWRRQVEGLLDYVASQAPASLHVFIVAVPPLSSMVKLPRWFGMIAERSVRAINAQLAVACAARRNVTFIPFTPDGQDDGASRSYLRWAEILAPLVSSALEPETQEQLRQDARA